MVGKIKAPWRAVLSKAWYLAGDAFPMARRQYSAIAPTGPLDCSLSYSLEGYSINVT